MPTAWIDRVLERYAAALATLEEAAPHPSKEQILNTLVARDVVHAMLTDRTQDPPESLMTVIDLDLRLKEQSEAISRAVELSDLRASLNPKAEEAEAWWWFLEPPARSHWWGCLTALTSAFTIIFLAVAASLVTDISQRFLSGGPDTWAAFAVIAQTILTVLIAGSALTEKGRDAVKRTVANVKVLKRFQHVIVGVLAFLLVLGLVALRFSLPRIAVLYNNRGLDDQRDGRLTTALHNYNRALMLNPDYVEAHYNLGLLYEDQGDPKSARAEYQIAARGGLDAAYNNLARLYILDQEYEKAVPLLTDGLALAQDDDVKYYMLKNLGWARLGQTRYAEAEVRLRAAIDLIDDIAPAHCLLAQVLEGQGDAEAALVEWNECQSWADGHNPDEDVWIDMARRRLEPEE